MSMPESPGGAGADRPRSERAGFSLVELTVVVLLGTLLIAASYQVLTTNQRTYTVNEARITAQQTVRAGLEILTAELREVGGAGGDVLEVDDDSVEVWVLRGAGIVCEVDIPGNKMVILPLGSGLSSDDSIFMFADNHVDRRDDDMWHQGKVGSVSSGATCPGGAAGAETVNLPGWNARLTQDSVRRGAPVRSYRRYVYGAYVLEGETFLGRQGPSDAAPQPLVGPLRSRDGLRFTYFDSVGAETDVPEDVRRIQVTLRTPPTVRGPAGEQVADSVTSWIYTRN